MDEYRELYEKSIRQPEEFWGKIAEQYHWFKKWDKVREWQLPDVKWFVGGKTNLSYNCLDLQIERGRGDHPAILWEGEPGDRRTLTYGELKAEVCKFANALKKLGVRKGDRVTIYMPMVFALERVPVPRRVRHGARPARSGGHGSAGLPARRWR